MTRDRKKNRRYLLYQYVLYIEIQTLNVILKQNLKTTKWTRE